jgi:DNA-binding Lrp family transcriptional regulator
LELFNRCSKHNAIITGKALMIKADGFETESLPLEEFIKANDINEVLYKASLDLEMFGGFYLDIIWSIGSGKIAAIEHIDFSKIRVSDCETKFYYCEDWADMKLVRAEGGVRQLKQFNANINIGRAVLYVKQYRPDCKVYPLPDYIGAIASIETDIEIANFHLNNIKNGFSAGMMINFNNGQPTPDIQREIARKLKLKKQGTDNAGEVIINFSDSKDKAPEILPLTPSDLDKQFLQLREDTTQEIFTGHKITSPMLFGIKQAGQLGGRTELLDSFELFQNTYINSRQTFLEYVFNNLFAINQLGEAKIKKVKPLGYVLSENILTQILSKDELRKMIGYEAAEVAPIEPVVEATKLDKEENIIKLLSECGVNEHEYEIVAHNFSNQKFALEDIDKQILQMIKDDRFATTTNIAKALKVDITKVVDRMNVLNADGYISNKVINQNGTDIVERTLTSSGETISKIEKPLTTIETKYKYDGPEDSKNRPFCAKLMELKKLYTRDEIDKISAAVDYNVFAMRGGFYHNPKIDLTTPYCRHTWKQVTVIKKNK